MSTHASTRPPVVVGVDGHAPSRVALDWAIDEAHRRRLPIHLVYARPMPLRGPTPDPGFGRHTQESDAILGEAVDRVRALAPDMEVSTSSGYGSAGPLLVDAARGAGCLVVGARGRGAFASALLGSTSVDVAAHAHCPVVVVRELPTAEPVRPRVVVGSDGSEVSAAAIEAAFFQADQRGLALTVVHAWFLEAASALTVLETTQARTRVAEQERALAAEATAGWSEKYPDVVVHHHVVNAHPVEALVEHSRGAELVVVGSRGRGGFTGLLLGSVSLGVLHHAHCPVLVIPPNALRRSS